MVVYLNYNINTKFQLGENQNTNLLFRTSHRSLSGLKETSKHTVEKKKLWEVFVQFYDVWYNYWWYVKDGWGITIHFEMKVSHCDSTCWPSSSPVAAALKRFSFCLLLQNHTRTTSLSIPRFSASPSTSCEDGLGLEEKCFSSTLLTVTSMDVLFFRFLPWVSRGLQLLPELLSLSASSNHLISNGLSLHMFLKLNCRASKRQMWVWLNMLPYIFPKARPTSAWVKCSLIRRCLNSLANSSKSTDVGASSSCKLNSALSTDLSEIRVESCNKFTVS